MKKFTVYCILLCLLFAMLPGCAQTQPQIVATTLPVYEFTSAICAGTDLQVGQLVTESVSCLHDYTLTVSQMQMVENAEILVISGAGLEDFLGNVLNSGDRIIDSSAGCHLHAADGHAHEQEDTHQHDVDPHLWLSPENATIMARNICAGLADVYPQHAELFASNLAVLTEKLTKLQSDGEKALQNLSTRKLITFHDGFAYFAESFDLTILEAIEEESGSEASAQELKHLITLVNEHQLPAVFTEQNGSASAAGVICAETGTQVFSLDMAMAGESYFDAMYHNINTIKEALG